MKVYTNYGWLEILTEDEEYKFDKGYFDGKLEDGTELAVGLSDETGKLVCVKEREDGTHFAVIEEV